MIDFSLNEEQEALRQLAREFAQKEVAPVASHYDQTGEFPWEILKKAHEIGLMNLTVPEEYGGGGLGTLEDCLVTEELAAACAGTSSSVMGNSLGVTPILLAGNPEQKKRLLSAICAEPILCAFNLTEPGAGSDVAATKTQARRVGDEYILNGTKQFITNGGVASYHTVFAVTDPEKGTRGFSAFVVPADTPGLSTGREEDKMGHRASNTTQVIYEEVRVPKENRLGAEGEGFKIAMRTLDASRAGIAALSVGVARAAMEAAIEYSKERQQFGQPISHFQAIQFMLADMAIKIETARLITWKAAWLHDHGQRNTFESAIAKCYASDIAMQVATDAVQIFGGYGYIKEYPVEKYMRDAKLMQIYEGTNQIQRIVISRLLLS
ncbi:MAG: acyl-CoA dehydrogenase family protein [Anaerolineae bacterium]